MAKKHRQFKNSTSKAREIGFALLDQEFECLPYIPATASAALASNLSGSTVMEFLEGVLVENDVLRFQNLVSSKDTVVPMDTLIDIVNWLVEEYIGVPLEGSSSSTNGQETTARIVTVSSD